MAAALLRPGRAPIDLSRTVVVGTSCSGKTTFAAQLAAHIGAPHVELDAIHWGPNWSVPPDDEFRAAVATACAGERWVVDGNYSKVQDLVWPRATAVMWLNHSFALIFWRALRRTVRRVVRQEELFSGNRETFRDAFLSKDSILWWVITTYRRRRREYRELLRGNYAHLAAVEFRRPGEVAEFFAALTEK